MKNRKNVIIVIAIIVIVAIGFGIFKISTSYLFNENGKIEDGHTQLINHIKSIENDAERKNQIDYKKRKDKKDLWRMIKIRDFIIQIWMKM